MIALLQGRTPTVCNCYSTVILLDLNLNQDMLAEKLIDNQFQ